MVDLKDLTSFKWATVKVNAPLSIQLDGDTAPLGLIPDTLVDPLTLSAGDRVRVELSLRKVVVHGVASGIVGVEAGRVEMTAAQAAPAGWLLCQGQSLLRSDYPRLFAAISTAYGAVDSTHFNVPDLRGRVPVGIDTSQTEFDSRGEKGGLKTTNHGFIAEPINTGNSQDGGSAYQNSARGDVEAWVQQAGGSAVTMQSAIRGLGGAVRGASTTNTEVRHGRYTSTNLQPYLTVHYMIKI